MVKKIGSIALVVGAVLSMAMVKDDFQQHAWQTTEKDRVSVHDPSIVSAKDASGKTTYYIFGSHLAEAKSQDLMTWQVPFTKEYENPDNNIILGNLQENLKESFAWAGYNDADSANGYAIWGADVIWNKDFKWADGSTGAYMYFYSTSSTWRRSCIGYAVAKTIEGPYKYVDTVIYSGFTKNTATDGSTRNVQYANTNLKKLIANGTVSGFNDKWATGSGKVYNTDYAPNAIDPTLFYGKDGKLWMTYGSWSGGIFVLEVDPATGQPKYPGVDGTTADGRVIDRYFGTKIAGGYHQSGEGAFIQYDAKTDYYYFFETYGGLLANGGDRKSVV